MKLVHPNFPCKIEFKENQIQTLVIENHKLLSEYLAELLQQVNGGEGLWVLSERGEIYQLQKKCQIIIDPFSLDFNQRKMINTLYEKIEKKTLCSEVFLEWNKLYPAMMDVLEEMIEGFDYSLSYASEIEMKDFLKIMNLHFDVAAESLAERLIDYMCLVNEVLGIFLFVFVNIKSYLDDAELKHLFQQAFYKKIFILLLESCISEQKNIDEKVTIIDKDCCVITPSV